MTGWTQERTDELLRLRDAGLTAREIATRLGCTIPAIYSKHSDMQAHPKRRPVHPNATPERLEKIRGLLADGLSVKAVAERLKVTKNVVCGLISRHELRAGLPPSPLSAHMVWVNAGRAARAAGLPPPPPKAKAPPKEPRVRPRAPAKPLPEFGAVVASSPAEPGQGKHRVPLAPRYRWLNLARPTGVATYAPAPDRKCMYPLNDGERGRWLFCDAATPETGPYCDDHAKRCYTGRPTRGEGAA